MEGFLIAGLVMGAVCILVSFFTKDTSKLEKEEKEKLIQEIREVLSSKSNIEEIVSESQKVFHEKLDSLISEKLLQSEDTMNEHSNNKMIALNDMYENLASKIDHNHKEVVFLYDMLNQKSEEIKSVTSQIEGMKKSLQEEEKKLIMKFQYVNKKLGLLNQMVEDKEREAVHQIAESKKGVAVKNKKKQQPVTEVSSPEKEGVDMNQKILSMREEGMSVVEISKKLGMGQGEVSLILGIYGKNG